MGTRIQLGPFEAYEPRRPRLGPNHAELLGQTKRPPPGAEMDKPRRFGSLGLGLQHD